MGTAVAKGTRAAPRTRLSLRHSNADSALRLSFEWGLGAWVRKGGWVGEEGGGVRLRHLRAVDPVNNLVGHR